MGTRSADVDAYIERAQPFARPILRKLRALFHRACPAVEERLKWGAPSFEYKGMLGGMAAFKQHVRWGLWKAKLLKDPHGLLRGEGGSGWGKATTVSELLRDAIVIDLIKQAAALNDKGVKSPARAAAKPPVPKTPSDLAAALRKNGKA